MKILISGGHLTPALAVCDYLQTEYPEVKITFVGREYSQDSTSQKAQEKSETKKRDIPFIAFKAPRLGGGLKDKVLWPFNFIKSYAQALSIMTLHRPTVFVSFGGYLAVPLALAAWTVRVPIITHEQTRTLGVANGFIAKLAKIVAVSFPETLELLPKNKTIVTGNPLRPELLQTKTTQPSWLTVGASKPILYITGGNQGSQTINTLIGQLLLKLTKDWLVIHQCGNPMSTTNYRQQLEVLRSQLPPRQQTQYFIQEWVDTAELAWIYKHATCVISRSGANTVCELAALAIPSILIPLPFSHHDEQKLNAQWLVEQGGGILVPQREASPQKMLEALQFVASHADSMRQSLDQKLKLKNGAEQLSKIILSFA